MAEAAAAREQAEYEKRMADKENKLKQFEAEEERKREQQRAKYERDMAILAAYNRPVWFSSVVHQSILNNKCWLG